MAETIGLPAKAGTQNLINPLTGFLSKMADVAGEIFLVREQTKLASSKRNIGSVSPTGQNDPARVASETTSASDSKTPNEKMIGGLSPKTIGFGIGGLILFLGTLFILKKK